MISFGDIALPWTGRLGGGAERFAEDAVPFRVRSDACSARDEFFSFQIPNRIREMAPTLRNFARRTRHIVADKKPNGRMAATGLRKSGRRRSPGRVYFAPEEATPPRVAAGCRDRIGFGVAAVSRAISRLCSRSSAIPHPGDVRGMPNAPPIVAAFVILIPKSPISARRPSRPRRIARAAYTSRADRMGVRPLSSPRWKTPLAQYYLWGRTISSRPFTRL